MELNFLGHEAVRQMVNAMLGYKPDGQPMWLLRTVRTICVQYMKALGGAYPVMPAAEKTHLCRLMLYEAMQRALRACEGNEAMHLFFVFAHFYFEWFLVYSLLGGQDHVVPTSIGAHEAA